jgi:hypothetical protein
MSYLGRAGVGLHLALRFAILFLMDIFASTPFLIGSTPSAPEPLARYLPPVTQGVVSAWLTQHVPAGAWVLDPFGSSPIVAVEAARAGYRVLVAANNPPARLRSLT